jgi:hypothetical protein
MDQNFFFRWLWRFNAVALAIYLIPTLFIFVPFFMWQVSPSVEQVTGPFSESKPGDPALQLFLDFQREGRREVVFMLAPTRDPGAMIKSDDSRLGATTADTTRVANYLFIDPITGSGRWLFPTNNQVITATEYVTKNLSTMPYIATADSTPPLAVVYDVRAAGSAPGPNTKYHVFISKLDGTNLTTIFDEVDEVPLFVPAADNTIVTTYKLKGRLMVATVSLIDFKILVNKELSTYAQQ